MVYAGSGALSGSAPAAEIHKSFLLLFSKKEALSFLQT
jgi:hypothetical protein